MMQLEGLIITAISIYRFAILIYILMSWFPGARESAFGAFLGKICEPLLEQFRRFIPPIGGMIDISPIAALIVLSMAQLGVRSIFDML